MPQPLRQFSARFDALPDILAHIDAFYVHVNFNTLRRAKIVVEELFTNSIKYGYTKNANGNIKIYLSDDIDSIHIRFEDQAPPFNPFEELSLSVDKLEHAQQQGGGFGCLLIKNLADSAHYSYINGHNRIELTFSV